MRVLLADDHNMVRDALKTYVERLVLDAMVHTATNVDEAHTIASRGEPLDVIILDLKMPGMRGLEGMVRMRECRPDVPVVIMSGLASQDEIREAMNQGAYGFFPKTLSGPALVTALRLVMAGEKFVPVDALSPDNSPTHLDEGAANLTPREGEVLGYLKKGWSNKEIARALDLQEVTIKLHVRGICRKLGAKNRTQAAMKAQESRA